MTRDGYSRRPPTRRAVAALAVAVLAVTAVVAPAAARAPVAAHPVTGPPAADGPRFVDDALRQHRGDVVRIPVAVAGGSNATVTVRANGTGYNATVGLHDGNGDGRVTLLFNTYAAGSGTPGGAFRAGAEGDAAAVRAETAVDGPLPAGEYALSVAPADDTANATDAATLRLVPAGQVEVRVLRADPALLGDLTTPRAVARARVAGELYRVPPVDNLSPFLVGGALVLEVRAPGLAGALAAADGPNATARFRTLLGSGVTVWAVEDERTVQPEEDPVAFRLRNAVGYRVVPDPANDTYHLFLGVVETNRDAGSPVRRLERGDVVLLTATVAVAREGTASGDAAVEFLRAHATIDETDDGRLPDAAADGTLTVTGQATLPTGENLTVRVESPAGDPFPLARRVPVEDGAFETAFDLSGVPPGTALAAVVSHDGEPHDRVAGVVGPAASVRFVDREVFVQHVEYVAVDGVRTTGGGFVVLRRGSPGGPVVGTSAYLPRGNHTGVRVPLDVDLDGNTTLFARVHRDADGDREFDPGGDPVYEGGAPTDAATLVDVDGAAAPPPTPTHTPLPVTAPSPGTPPLGDPVPGFGPAAALVALAGAALVAARRRDD